MTTEHVVPIRTYIVVLIALLVLLALTVGVAYFHLGVFNIWIAMGIAFTKAALVGLFFMHLRYSGWVVALFSFSGLYWLAILIGLSLADYLTR